MRRIFVASAAVLTASALVLVGTSPAWAAGRSMPSGDQMYTLDSDEAGEVQGWSVNASDAAVTQIGGGTLVDDELRARPAAYNPKSGVSYFVDVVDAEGDFNEYYYLDTFNPVTGASTYVGEFYAGPVYGYPEITSIAIGNDGAAYAIDQDSFLYTLDLGTAALTYVAELDGFNYYGFAVDPTTGVFWVFSNDGLGTVEVSNGAESVPVNFDLPFGRSIAALQIDSAGVAWFINGPMLEDSVTELWSRAADGVNVLSGNLNDEGIIRLAGSLLIIPAPKLAATGAPFEPVVLVGASLLLLIGGAFVLVRRRTATA